MIYSSVLLWILAFQTAFLCVTGVAEPFSLDVWQMTVYTVEDGRSRALAVSKDQLESSAPLCFRGYVSGIVVLCGEGIKVTIDGQEANRIKKLPDGSFSLKYFGKIKPEELVAPASSAGIGDKNEEGKIREAGSKPGAGSGTSEGGISEGAIRKPVRLLPEGGYCLFPKIAGDSITPNGEFTISISNGLQTIAIPVRHSAYATICLLGAEAGEGRSAKAFRYLGQSHSSLSQSASSTAQIAQIHATRSEPDLRAVLPSDFEDRSRAIVDGISVVERTFGMELVAGVNIVDYREARNAVTCDEGKDIWFYADTFLGESLVELRTIATHESLHKYVARKEFPLRSDVRELFADIDGYDLLSPERFMIMTAGKTPATDRRAAPPGRARLFFDFIDERNFLEGMKGGHSHSGIEELCVSFLHSLLNIDRLESNLNRSLKPYGNPQPRHAPSALEKGEIMATYIRAIEALRSALHWAPDERGSGSSGESDPSRLFFDECLAKARTIRDRLADNY